jgi:hypothetical protein
MWSVVCYIRETVVDYLWVLLMEEDGIQRGPWRTFDGVYDWKRNKVENMASCVFVCKKATPVFLLKHHSQDAALQEQFETFT